MRAGCLPASVREPVPRGERAPAPLDFAGGLLVLYLFLAPALFVFFFLFPGGAGAVELGFR